MWLHVVVSALWKASLQRSRGVRRDTGRSTTSEPQSTDLAWRHGMNVGGWYEIWNDNVDVHPTKMTTFDLLGFFFKWWFMLRHSYSTKTSVIVHLSNGVFRVDGVHCRSTPQDTTNHAWRRKTRRSPLRIFMLNLHLLAINHPRDYTLRHTSWRAIVDSSQQYLSSRRKQSGLGF